MNSEMSVICMQTEYLLRNKLWDDVPLWMPKKLPSKNVVTAAFYYQNLHRMEKCIKGLKELHEAESKRIEFSKTYGKSKLASLYGEINYKVDALRRCFNAVVRR